MFARIATVHFILLIGNCTGSEIGILAKSQISVTDKRGNNVIVENTGYDRSWFTAKTLLITKGITKVRVLDLSNSEIHLMKIVWCARK